MNRRTSKAMREATGNLVALAGETGSVVPRSGTRTGPPASPPRLVGGANSQGEHRTMIRPDESICIDWMTWTGPDEVMERLKVFLCDHCGLGDPDPDNKKGGKYYSRGYHWGHIGVFYNPQLGGLGRFKIDVPGSGCDMIRETCRLSDLCRFLYENGCKPTRIDIAVDFYSEDGTLSLVQDVIDACGRHELVDYKVVEIRADLARDGSSFERSGGSVTIGRRGNSSAWKQACFYDKGLQTGEARPNRWHRFEARFGGDNAVQLAPKLAEDLPETRFRAEAMGIVDFMDNPGARRRDRQRASWWASVVDDGQVRTIRPRRRKSSLDGVRHWIDKAVASALQTYALASEKPLAALVAELIGKPPEPSTSVAGTQAFREWCRHLNIAYWEGLRRAGFQSWTKAFNAEARMARELCSRIREGCECPSLAMVGERRRLV